MRHIRRTNWPRWGGSLVAAMLSALLISCTGGNPDADTDPDLLWTSHSLPAREMTAERSVNRIDLAHLPDGIQARMVFASAEAASASFAELGSRVIHPQLAEPWVETDVVTRVLIWAPEWEFAFATETPIVFDDPFVKQLELEGEPLGHIVHLHLLARATLDVTVEDNALIATVTDCTDCPPPRRDLDTFQPGGD